jgi:adenine-specific DNA-methyltransferase
MFNKKTNCIVEVSDNLSFLDKVPDKSVQLVITSPPYNVGKEYEKTSSLASYLEGQEKLITKCVDKMSDTGSICWQVGNSISKKDSEVIPLDIVLYPIFKKLGLTLKNRIVWQFGHGLHCTNRLSGRHETILWFVKDTNEYTFNLDPIRVPSKYPGKKYYKGPRKGELSGNPLGKNPGDVWTNIPNVKNNHPEKTTHPCQFPVELIERFVLSLTNKGDIVLDPYLGAGTTVIAALKNERKGWGCDIENKYIDIALDRIKLLKKGELKTRAMNTPIYEPKTKKDDSDETE